MIIIPIKSTCRSKFKLHCRNMMKEGEHRNTLTSFLTRWTKKTAAKKLDKVSRRPIFGSSSPHAAPFQSSKRSASGSAFQSTAFLQLHRNLLDSARGWNFPFSISTILEVFPEMKCLIAIKKQNNNKKSTHIPHPQDDPGDLSFANLQCSRALEQEPEIWKNSMFVHMLYAVPNLHKYSTFEKCHVNEPWNLLDRVKGQGGQWEVFWAVLVSSPKAGLDKIHREETRLFKKIGNACHKCPRLKSGTANNRHMR